MASITTLLKVTAHCLQAQLTERALELLALPDDGQTKLLLDLGCGSGLSGAALSDQGHTWVVRPAATCTHLAPAAIPLLFTVSYF